MALRLLRLHFPLQKSFGYYSENAAVLRAAARPRDSHLAIKSHYLSPEAAGLERQGAVKMIYTWRNPYDVVASCLAMFGPPLERWIEVLRQSLRLWRVRGTSDDVWVIAYETLRNHPALAVEEISQFLGLGHDSAICGQIAQELSIDQVRKMSAHIASLKQSRLIRENGFLFDRETLLHLHHVKNGGIGYGVRVLPEGALSIIDAVLNDEGFEFLCNRNCGVGEPAVCE